MSELANKQGYDWNRIKGMMSYDHRIGPSHTAVPGPDGFYGFGGMCFPKDTSALLKFSEKINTSLNVLDASVKKNSLLRLKKTN